MTKKTYPEAIYKDFPTCGSEQGNIAAHAAGRQHAYDRGFEDGQQAQGDPLAGWSNLTEAIQAGERIDWERLDGLEAQCVHPEMGALTSKLERNTKFPPARYTGWFKGECGFVWFEAFQRSWLGHDGWALYIKGELPLRKLTADELEPGTCFLDIKGNSHIVYITPRGEKVAYARYGSHDKDPKYVYVGKVLGVGTFQEPKEDA